jgi:acyl-CoA synthetase (AMP-forming)/AMP-acid ligase II
VAGPTATDSYFNREAATRAAKIREPLADGGSRIVHRMGDVGYFDGEGRLWFCGRKTQRVDSVAGPLFTEQAEPVFNVHPQAAAHRAGRCRCGRRAAAGAVRGIAGRCGGGRPGIEAELRALGAAHAATAGIDTFLRHPAFPVDIRHNAKIGREKLAVWAGKQLEHRA